MTTANNFYDCAICLEPLIAGCQSDDGLIDALRPCGHIFHKKCYRDWSHGQPNSGCLLCRKPVSRTTTLPKDVAFIAPDFVATKTSGKSKKKTAKQFAEGEVPTPAELMRATIEFLHELIEVGKMGPTEVRRLDQEIDLAEQDAKKFEYLGFLSKLSNNVLVIYSTDPRVYDGTQELKFLLYKSGETEDDKKKSKTDLQTKKEEFSKILQEKRDSLAKMNEYAAGIEKLKILAKETNVEIPKKVLALVDPEIVTSRWKSKNEKNHKNNHKEDDRQNEDDDDDEVQIVESAAGGNRRQRSTSGQKKTTPKKPANSSQTKTTTAKNSKKGK